MFALTVSTPYPGASPTDVEQGVTRKVEEVVAGLSGLKNITSQSREGLSVIVAEFAAGTDMEERQQDAQRKVSNLLADLPADVQLSPVMSFASVGSAKSPLWMAAGNFYGTIPYEGRYDALPPTMFTYDAAAKRFRTVSSLHNNGEVRDLKWISSARNGRILAIAHNNDRIRFYSSTNN